MIVFLDWITTTQIPTTMILRIMFLNVFNLIIHPNQVPLIILIWMGIIQMLT